MVSRSFLVLDGGSKTTNLAESDIPSRLIFEALKSHEQDWKYVELGLRNSPWDNIATAGRKSNRLQINLVHKQSNTFFVLSETGRLVREATQIFQRRNKYNGQPSGEVWLKQQTSTTTSIRYPEYFLNDFHHQTDGWFSSSSANVYESITEVFFLGRQDAMQRQTLVPLLNHFGAGPPQDILEVACGTRRFATFVRDNFPQAEMTLTDLSPFYLEKARDNDKYWKNYRGEKA